MHKNVRAFLETIAISEIGSKMLAESDNGYNVIVGSRPGKMKLFHDYADHPRVLIELNEELSSTAAGRYQIKKNIYDHYKRTLKLPDFSPESQEKIAMQLIRECRAITDIEQGLFFSAVRKCVSRWASLPGAGYGQHEHKLSHLQAAYVNAGGTLADGIVA